MFPAHYLLGFSYVTKTALTSQGVDKRFSWSVINQDISDPLSPIGSSVTSELFGLALHRCYNVIWEICKAHEHLRPFVFFFRILLKVPTNTLLVEAVTLVLYRGYDWF